MMSARTTSAPGARLLVRAEGSASGAFGGADTDARAHENGLRAPQAGEAGMVAYHLDAEGGESVGSCGATLEVFVDPVQPEARLLGVLPLRVTCQVTKLGLGLRALGDLS
jgi:xanthine dehydrogenase accessory factor